MNPYAVLGITKNVDDKTVRAAYLALVRKFPPDLHPERFKKLCGAYEKLKSHEARAKHFLFDKEQYASSPIGAVIEHEQFNEKRTPMKWELMKSFLKECYR